MGVSGFGTDDPEKEFDQELFAHAVEPPVAFQAGDGRGLAVYAGEFPSKGGPVHQVIAEILCANQVTQITLMCQRAEEKQWAFDLLRAMNAHADYNLS